MIVRAQKIDWSNADEQIEKWAKEGQTLVTPEKDYGVGGIVHFKGMVFYLILDDMGFASWRPYFLFAVMNSQVGTGWVANSLFGGTIFVVGDPAVAANEEVYTACTEGDSSRALEVLRAKYV